MRELNEVESNEVSGGVNDLGPDNHPGKAKPLLAALLDPENISADDDWESPMA